MFIDLGRKQSTISEGSVNSEKKRIYYPSFYVDGKSLPIDEKDVGKTIMASVKLRVNSVEKKINKKGKVENSNFDVIAIDFMKNKSVKNLATLSSSQLDELELAEFEKLKKNG